MSTPSKPLQPTDLEELPPAAEASPCSASTKAGRPCRAWGIKDGLCLRHSQSPAERSAQGRAGALAANQTKTRRAAEKAAAKLQQAISVLPADLTVKIDSQTDFTQTLVSVIEATANGQLSAAKARAVTGLLKLRLDAESLAISAKLVELERRLKDRPQGGGFVRRV